MAVLIANAKLTHLMMLTDTEENGADYIPNTTEVAEVLSDLAEIIGTYGPEVRETMEERNAYGIICQAWSLCCWSGAKDVPSPAVSAGPCRDATLAALYAVTTGYPDIIDDIGWQIIVQAIDKNVPPETQILLLKLLRNVCIKSEDNREFFTWTLGLLDDLVFLARQNNPSCEFIREWCATIKSLLLSDDPRVPYNRSMERKRAIADTQILPILAGFLSKPEYEEDVGALNALIILLGTMAVNENWCTHIDNGNALPALFSIMKTHFHNKTLLRNSISLLRYLASTQEIREKLDGYKFLKLLLEVLNYYKKEADILDVTVNCLAYMTLNNACQSNQFITRNGLSHLQQIMTEYNKDVTILKGACFLLRNVTENTDSDGRETIAQFVTLFSQLVDDVPELKEYYIAPILRELGIDPAAMGQNGEEEEEEEHFEEQGMIYGEDEYGGEDFLQMMGFIK